MSEPGSGQSGADDRFARGETILDDWEESLGLPRFRVSSLHNEATKLLELGAMDRKKLTPDDCADAVVVLANFAGFINRACQREEALAERLGDEIRRLVAGEVLGAGKFIGEELREVSIQGNREASRLASLQRLARARYNRLKYQANRIDATAKAYQNLSLVRQRDRQHN